MLNIIEYPDPILSETSHSVRDIDEEIRSFIVEMISTMKMGNGIGLAAPQVGVLKKIIVMEVDGWQKVMINPVIRQSSEMRISIEEGCLSVPDRKIVVQRSPFVRVEYKDLNNKRHRETLSALKAIVVQHEIDHLNGITIIERANRIGPEINK